MGRGREACKGHWENGARGIRTIVWEVKSQKKKSVSN